ncbi:MAG: hypothetical protein EA397_08150 [Deltaproteobacteria bacterium]|nr:MAG: hypothetical protein EA397_08150 [Deltaproteobacteria bacterium]
MVTEPSHSRDPETPGALRAEAERMGASMIRRFGWFHWLLGLRRALRHVRFDDASAERIRQAANRGPVVYVLLRSSNLDHLALNHVLNRRLLPLSIWANGVTQFFWQPVVQAWSGLFQRLGDRLAAKAPPDPISSGWITRALAANEPVTLFLEPATGLWRNLARRWQDPLPALLEAQAALDRPIQVVPISVVWQRGLGREVHPAVRMVLADPDRPWGVTRLGKLILYPSDSVVVAGEPVDLSTFFERVPQPERRRRTLFVLLRRYLRREGQVVRGPRLPSPASLRANVLDNPPMRALLASEAERTGEPPERIRRKMEREYDRIAAHMRWWIIRVLDVLLRPLWTRVYSGVDAPEEDMEHIRQAIRDGAAIALPSHKSHFDYLLLAWVFYQHKLTLPHVVAGMNLALPVVSFFLRSAGGFFLERTFAGKVLHPPIFARYLRELIHHGAPIELYIEGGRTRSGKLLPPKVGVLDMIFDAAALRPKGHEVTLLPIALAYEQVAEQGAYVRELGGQRKRKEDLGQVAKASSVLRRRLGRVYLRVGTPIPLGPLVDPSDEREGWMQRSREDRKLLLNHIGHKVMHEVGQRTVLLPTTLVALALLAHSRRGIEQKQLLDRTRRFRSLIARHQIPEAASLSRFEEAMRLSLSRLADQRLIEHFEHQGERIWAVRVERRLELDFAKNQGLHPLVPAGLAACALRAVGEGASLEALSNEVAWLRRLWRREFLLDPDASALEVLQLGLADLTAHGALSPDPPEAPTIDDRHRIAEVYGLFRPFLEAYIAVASTAPEVDGARLGRKEWVAALQRRSEALLAAGTISRPEALSLVTLENAVKVYLDDGALILDEREHLASRPDKLGSIVDRLRPLVHP